MRMDVGSELAIANRLDFHSSNKEREERHNGNRDACIFEVCRMCDFVCVCVEMEKLK